MSSNEMFDSTGRQINVGDSVVVLQDFTPSLNNVGEVFELNCQNEFSQGGRISVLFDGGELRYYMPSLTRIVQ